MEMHRLKDKLKYLYPSGTIFSTTNMDDDMMEDMLLNSSASTALIVLFKDIKTIIHVPILETCLSIQGVLHQFPDGKLQRWSATYGNRLNVGCGHSHG